MSQFTELEAQFSQALDRLRSAVAARAAATQERPDERVLRERIDALEAEKAELVDELAGSTRLAIDTEFHRERTYWPQCALVQIGWDGGQALVDPLAVDIRALGPLLLGRTTVMHAAGQDLEVFQHSVGVVPEDLFDTQIAAMVAGFGDQVSYDSLCRSLAGVSIEKAHRFSDWSARPLSASQIAYAAADVTHLTGTANQYLAILGKDREAFGQSVEAAIAERMGGLQREQQQLQADTENLTRQLAEIQQKLAANQARLAAIGGEVAEQSGKLNQNRQNYEATYGHFTGQIREDLAKIARYLK